LKFQGAGQSVGKRQEKKGEEITEKPWREDPEIQGKVDTIQQ